MRPAFFVVTRRMGNVDAAIYWDELPERTPIRNPEYIIRLDQQPNAEALCKAKISDLIAVYLHMKKRNKLPPRWEPPKPKKADTPSSG